VKIAQELMFSTELYAKSYTKDTKWVHYHILQEEIMKKSFIFKILLLFTIFVFGYSHLNAFDEKRDKEVKTVELKHYLSEKGVDKNEAKAWDLLQQAAREGDAAAIHKIGTMYELGIYVDKDYTWAMLWYIRSAVRGYAPAQSDVGILYEDGLGGYRDVTAALFWYEKAAAQDEPFAVEAVQRLKKEVNTDKVESVISKKGNNFTYQKKCLKAEKDSAYLWIKFSNDQAYFIRKETQKLPNFDMLISIANLRKDMQKLEKYKTRKKELMDNIEYALSSYSDSIQQIGTLSSQAVKYGFTRNLDFLKIRNDEEQIQVLKRVKKHVEEYQKNKRINAEQWKKDIIL